MVLVSYRVSMGSAGSGSDANQFERRLRRVAEGSVAVEELSSERRVRQRRRQHEPTHVSFDNDTSSRATIFYVQATDRAQLLYDLASVFSQHECNIDVVLSDTQGHRASDVFYLRRSGAKLTKSECEALQTELVAACRS